MAQKSQLAKSSRTAFLRIDMFQATPHHRRLAARTDLVAMSPHARRGCAAVSKRETDLTPPQNRPQFRSVACLHRPLPLPPALPPLRHPAHLLRMLSKTLSRARASRPTRNYSERLQSQSQRQRYSQSTPCRFLTSASATPAVSVRCSLAVCASAHRLDPFPGDPTRRS